MNLKSPTSKLTTPKRCRHLQLVVLCLYAFLYGKFYLVMSGIQFSLEQQAKITSNASLLSAINTVSLVQIGLLMGLPMVMEMGLEQGFRQVTGGLLARFDWTNVVLGLLANVYRAARILLDWPSNFHRLPSKNEQENVSSLFECADIGYSCAAACRASPVTGTLTKFSSFKCLLNTQWSLKCSLFHIMTKALSSTVTALFDKYILIL